MLSASSPTAFRRRLQTTTPTTLLGLESGRQRDRGTWEYLLSTAVLSAKITDDAHRNANATWPVIHAHGPQTDRVWRPLWHRNSCFMRVRPPAHSRAHNWGGRAGGRTRPLGTLVLFVLFSRASSFLFFLLASFQQPARSCLCGCMDERNWAKACVVCVAFTFSKDFYLGFANKERSVGLADVHPRPLQRLLIQLGLMIAPV